MPRPRQQSYGLEGDADAAQPAPGGHEGLAQEFGADPTSAAAQAALAKLRAEHINDMLTLMKKYGIRQARGRSTMMGGESRLRRHDGRLRVRIRHDGRSLNGQARSSTYHDRRQATGLTRPSFCCPQASKRERTPRRSPKEALRWQRSTRSAA